jgi:hypothetical protein
MTVVKALELVRRVGAVDISGVNLKLKFPKRERASLQRAIDTLRQGKAEALTLLAAESQPATAVDPVGIPWAEAQARRLNRLFAEQGCTGQPGHITAATVAHGEREKVFHSSGPNVPTIEDMPVDLRNPHKHIDPKTGIWPMSEWGTACRRGFVSNERFCTGQVVPRTNRASTRKWRKLRGRATEKAAGESQ